MIRVTDKPYSWISKQLLLGDKGFAYAGLFKGSSLAKRPIELIYAYVLQADMSLKPGIVFEVEYANVYGSLSVREAKLTIESFSALSCPDDKCPNCTVRVQYLGRTPAGNARYLFVIAFDKPKPGHAAAEISTGLLGSRWEAHAA